MFELLAPVTACLYAVRMQSAQKTCPQLVSRARVTSERQIEHSGEEERVRPRRKMREKLNDTALFEMFPYF